MAPLSETRRLVRFPVAVVLALAAVFGAAEGAGAASVFSLPLRPAETADLEPLPDGSLIYTSRSRVIRVSPSGARAVLAGNGLYTGEPSDGARAIAVHLNPAAMSLAHDGSLLIVHQSRVWRVRQDGTIWLAAGADPATNQPAPAIGDGGPATQARLGLVTDVMALADGGFLIAATDQYRVRRVYPDGTIDTIAGSGEGAYGGDGGAAKTTAIGAPVKLAASAAGGLLILTGGGYAAPPAADRVWHVLPDGTIRFVAGRPGRPGFTGDGGPAVNARLDNPRAIESTPDGGFVIADTNNNRLRKVTPDGRILTLAGSGYGQNVEFGYGLTPAFSASGFFTGQGRSAEKAMLSGPLAIAPDPLGGWLIANSGGISQLAEPGRPRAGVAIVGVDVAGGRIEFVSSSAASVTLEQFHRGHVFAKRTVQAAAGRNRIRLPRGRRGPNTVVLTARSTSGSWDDDRVRLVFGGLLSARLANTVVEALVPSGASLTARRRDSGAHAADGSADRVGACKRFSRRRVDCEYFSEFGPCTVHSVRLKASGLLSMATYRCAPRGHFRRRPRKLSAFHPVPLL